MSGTATSVQTGAERVAASALSGCDGRSNTKAWKTFYEHQRAKGLSRIEALVVLAQRIARTAWSIYTHKTEFNPERVAMGLT